MSLQFYPLTIASIVKETPQCVAVSFHIPEHLKNIFTYTQGQNITLKATINGQEVRRSYSLCSSPLEQNFTIAIKQVPQGVFSTYANKQLQVGQVLEVMPPTGNFYCPLNAANTKSYLAFAAGSGITPILSIIKTTLQTEPHSTFTLVYGNTHVANIIFKEELEALKNKYLQRFNLIHILSREKADTPLNYGRINTEKHKQLQQVINYTTINEFFICGPEAMIFETRDYLLQLGINKKQIHFELFTSSQATTKYITQQKDNTPASAAYELTIINNGRSVVYSIKEPNTILDAALQNGADLPYACKGGMCCTCKAKLLKGQVKMDVHWGLEDDEIANGYILTCQSIPLTNDIVVDFDAK